MAETEVRGFKFRPGMVAIIPDGYRVLSTVELQGEATVVCAREIIEPIAPSVVPAPLAPEPIPYVAPEPLAPEEEDDNA